MAIDWEGAYNRLFEIINADGDDMAPEYIKGSDFLKVLSKIDYSIPRNYSEYMEYRKANGLKTSRVIYYKELLNLLPDAKRIDAYAAFIKHLEKHNLPKLKDLSLMFGASGDEMIMPIKPIDPKVSENFYSDVLDNISSVLKGLEQKKALYSIMGEEDIRDYLIGILESKYINTTATRESYNKSGKTDILLKYSDNTNLFVAECKIWNGQLSFMNAITQILNLYLTWRDSKAAVLIFVRNLDFTSVLIAIKKEIINHSLFVNHLGDRSESSYSYIFHLPGDKTREIRLEILAFHFPT